MTVDPPAFDIHGPLPEGRVALEASAGTGKTWTIAALVLRHVAEGRTPLDQLLVVTFTRAATGELRDRIRRRLAVAAAHLDAVVGGGARGHDDPVLARLAEASPEEVAARAGRVAGALASFDAATITTIHGFCHQVLASSGRAGDVDAHGRLVEEVDDVVRSTTRDLLVRHWADVPAAAHGDRPSIATAESVAKVALRDPRASIRPRPDDEAEPEGARALARLAVDVRGAVDRRKRQLGLLTFDDLLTRLAASLDDSVASPAILGAMRRQYAVALIDEFQDTDPVQWAILGRIFEDRTIVLIGDPKQAIYRFRGADVHAYLQVVSSESTRRSTLAVNQRSDERLVEVLNRLFHATTFGDAGIRHIQVGAAHTDRLTFPDGPREVFQVRVIEEAIKADDARASIAADLAAEVTRLLADGPTIEDEAVPGGTRRVVPGDCAVLVRANAEADLVKTALAAVGVHAVINGVGSVLETPAADDWRHLLEAMERPSSPSRVRTLALSPLIADTPRQVAEADDGAEAAMHDRAHRWARVTAEHGIATLVRTIQRETGFVSRLLAQEGGERYITDFEHIAELLHSLATSEHLGPSALLAWLGDQRSRTDELPAEQRARRLESDARAVQVLTIHRAKGLQFPVVFCPYLMSTGAWQSVPFVHHDAATGETVIDLGSGRSEEAKQAAQLDDRGEQLRLLYVALTRAEHRLVVWWFPYNRTGYRDTALTKVLCCVSGDQRVTADGKAPELRIPDGVAQAFDAVVGRLGPGSSWVRVPARPTPARWQPDADEPPRLVARTFTGDVDASWQRASYSALTRPVARRPVDSRPDVTPVREDEDDHELTPLPPPDEHQHLVLPLAGQPAGATFGTVVHAIIEHVDLERDDLQEAVAEEAGRQARRSGLAVPDLAGLAAGLVTSLRTPLGPAFGDVTLAGLGRRDRLDELEFELPLAHGDGHVTLARIGELLGTHLAPDDPFASYADALADRTLARRVRGFMTGSIDLVVRRAGEQGPVFHVVDHKTNRLFGPDEVGSTWHYRRGALVEAMVHSHYPLQALLYQVALHRYLQWRHPGYAPDRDLGAVGYLFLRGMVGPAAPVEDGTPCGVMTWRPPTSLVKALSSLLEEGR